MLSWIVLPVAKSYLEVGHFSTSRRLCSAIAMNVKLYMAMAVVMSLLLFVIWATEGLLLMNTFLTASSACAKEVYWIMEDVHRHFELF